MEEETWVAKLSRLGKGNPITPTLPARSGVRNAGGSQLKDAIQLAAGDSTYDATRSFRRGPEVANGVQLERGRNRSSALNKPGGARHKYTLLG